MTTSWLLKNMQHKTKTSIKLNGEIQNHSHHLGVSNQTTRLQKEMAGMTQVLNKLMQEVKAGARLKNKMILKISWIQMAVRTLGILAVFRSNQSLMREQLSTGSIQVQISATNVIRKDTLAETVLSKLIEDKILAVISVRKKVIRAENVPSNLTDHQDRMHASAAKKKVILEKTVLSLARWLVIVHVSSVMKKVTRAENVQISLQE